VKLEVFRSTGPASHDLAFEAEMLERAAAGRCSALLTSWTGPVVVLGYAQPPDDVDLGWCREQGVPVLRRLSGGTGVVHSGDLGVSLALPKGHPWAAEILGLYDRFLAVLLPALTDVGSRVERLPEPARSTRVRSPICFFDQLADTLVVDGRKAVGCSQVRRKGGVLIHAAVVLSLDPGLYARVFGVDEPRISENLSSAVSGVGWETVADAITHRLGAELGLESEVRPRTRPGQEHLEPYTRSGRWAPAPDDGMR
jgi:lipoate-protein ligase A